ncbi:hypothetical protein H4217_000847 [Coemansia sp. RSA 1939]|nr:hypothetical protein H4217_000847 [Coemansia sp. RSA 1939]KAJ2612152.1 hypothetical protein EV177_003135 [Coemansia sp. RSA 1804]
MLSNGDIILKIAQETFWLEHGILGQQHRLEYLWHINRYASVCREWRKALTPYLSSYLVILLSKKPRGPGLKNIARTKLSGMRPSSLRPMHKQQNGRYKENDQSAGFSRNEYCSVGRIRQRDGSTVYYSSNVPMRARRGVSRVQTIVFSIDETISEEEIDACLWACGYSQQPWPLAKTLCLRLESKRNPNIKWSSATYPLERAVQPVLAHAPFVSSFFLTRPGIPLALTRITMKAAFGQHCSHLERIDVHSDINCCRIPVVFPALTSLSISLDDAIALGQNVGSDDMAGDEHQQQQLMRIASRSLQKLALYNIKPNVLHNLFYGASGSNSIEFSCLKKLKIYLRIEPIAIGVFTPTIAATPTTDATATNDRNNNGSTIPEDDQDAVAATMQPLVFPKLESAYIFGYQQSAPASLFRALSCSPIKDLYIYLTLRNIERLELPRMTQLRNLRMYLPHLDMIQPTLDAVFLRDTPTPLQSVVLHTHLRMEGSLPDTLLLVGNMRSLNLGALIPFEQTRQILRELPRLVFLKTMVARDDALGEEMAIGEALDLVVAEMEVLSTSLQVLRLWHYEELCITRDTMNVRAAKIVALLASIPSLVKFRCRSTEPNLRNIIHRALRNPRIADEAGCWLRALRIGEGYL